MTEPSQDHLSGPHFSNKTLDKPSLSADTRWIQVGTDLHELNENILLHETAISDLEVRVLEIEECGIGYAERLAVIEEQLSEIDTRIDRGGLRDEPLPREDLD